jgi:tetratricopeptide (TPR) repeat protein
MKKIFSIVVLFALSALVNVRAQAAAPATTDATAPTLTLPTGLATPVGTASADAASANTTVSTPAPIAPIAVPADPTGAFSAGLASYAAGNYAKARGHFLTAEKQAVTPALEFNFGNACYSAGDYGEAILHYLRSLSLNPGDPDARQNLALARQALSITAPESTRLDSYSGMFRENTWTLLATLAGWAAIYLAFLPQLYRWGGITPKLLCGVMVLVAIGAGMGVWGVKQHDHDGVVTHADTALKLSPTAESGSIGMAQAGEMAQVQDAHGDYYKVLTDDGHLGWVDNTSYAPVWETD